MGLMSPPRERFRASVAVTVRLAKASETAARKARPAAEAGAAPSGAAQFRRSEA